MRAINVSKGLQLRRQKAFEINNSISRLQANCSIRIRCWVRIVGSNFLIAHHEINATAGFGILFVNKYGNLKYLGLNEIGTGQCSRYVRQV